MPSSFAPEIRTWSSDVVRVVDLDPVLAADDRDVPDGDIVRGNDDSPAYDRAGVADEILRPIEHERPLVNPG